MSRKKSKSKQESIKNSAERRTQRFSGYGRQFELEVERLLEVLRDEGRISSFVRHEPHSPEDADGKDFTVTRTSEGKDVSRDFGVTISMQSWYRARANHPHVPQFCFPIGSKPETIRKRILGLFDK